VTFLLAKRYYDRKGYAIALHAVGDHLGDTLAPIAVGMALTFLTWRHVLFQSLFGGFSPALCGFIADRFGILSSFYFLAFTIFAANLLVHLIPTGAPKREAVSDG